MKLRTTLFFIGLFSIVLVIYLAQSKRTVEVAEQEKKMSDDFKVQVEEKMPAFDKNEKINFIQVQEMNKEETFWLEKQNDGWKIIYPVRALADQALAQGMSGMVSLALRQKLLRPEGDWKEYGLDQPEIKIGVGTSAEAERHFLYLGKELPLVQGVFARWDEKKAYFLLPSAVKSAFRKSVYEVREKRVFMTPIPKIDRIYITMGSRTFDWTLRNGIWYWMEPLDLIGKTMPADQMMAVIQVLSKLYIKEFLDDSTEDGYSAGISMISERIQIRAGEKAESVFFGKEASMKTAYYAQRENEKKLFLIDQAKVIQILDLLDAIEKANHSPDGVSAISDSQEIKLEAAN